jgi:hypothetical protein
MGLVATERSITDSKKTVRRRYKYCFIVDELIETKINNINVVTFHEFCSIESEDKYYTIAIADSKARMKRYKMFRTE